MSWVYLCTQTATVGRSAIVGGKVGAPATVLTGLKCTQAFPADPQRLNELHIHPRADGVYSLFEVYVEGLPAIQHGDVFTLDGVAYAVRGVAKWSSTSIQSGTHLTVERSVYAD